ncbi:hypothetical protein FQN53_008289 [Emmonsiellopsis sp. PD_33]|nr:hypothetical protein FQN53_008289 [Emmonsiellopsis sp. PD_33]
MFSRIIPRSRTSFPLSSKHLSSQSRRLIPSQRTFTSSSSSRNAQQQQQQQQQQDSKPPSPHIAVYKSFTRPFLKVFLGGVLTYQIIYWTWLKLEMDEEKVKRNDEIAELEKKVREVSSKTS